MTLDLAGMKLKAVTHSGREYDDRFYRKCGGNDGMRKQSKGYVDMAGRVACLVVAVGLLIVVGCQNLTPDEAVDRERDLKRHPAFFEGVGFSM